MSRRRKLLQRILSGTADVNISFRELRTLLKALGFEEKIRGDHYIFTCDEVVEIINLQPRQSKAKPYQVKQVREIILRYQLGDVI